MWKKTDEAERDDLLEYGNEVRVVESQKERETGQDQGIECPSFFTG
jgi:hypothetical protein